MHSCLWKWIFIIYIACVLCIPPADATPQCPDLVHNHIRVQIIGVIDPQAATLDYLTAVAPILHVIQEVEQRLMTAFHLGLQIAPIVHISPDDCTPLDELVDENSHKGVYIRIHHNNNACMSDTSFIMEPYLGIIQAVTSSSVPLSSGDLLNLILTTMTPYLNDSDHCNKLSQALVPKEPVADNGIVEDSEECDVFYPIPGTPCVDQKLLPTWTMINRCPQQHGCALSPPIPECSFDGVRYDIELCTALIGLTSLPYPDGAFIYNNQCLDLTRCSPDSFEWGVLLPSDQHNAQSIKTYFPIRTVSKHQQYRCSPGGDPSQIPQCFPMTEEEGSLRRPDVTTSCILSLNSWKDIIPVDSELCKSLGPFQHLPCDYQHVSDTFPNILPSCLVSYCTSYHYNDDPYNTTSNAFQDPSQYQPCVKNATFGFPANPLACDKHGTIERRKSFCVFIDQHAASGMKYVMLEDDLKCPDAGNFSTTRPSQCHYDWLCSNVENNHYHPSFCTHCSHVNCADRILIQRNRKCFGHKNFQSIIELSEEDEYLCDDDDIQHMDRNQYPYPHPNGTVCPEESCVYQAQCRFVTESSSSSPSPCSQGFYQAIRKKENNIECITEPNHECGPGHFDPSAYEVTCTGKASNINAVTTNNNQCYKEIDSELDTVRFPCHKRCPDDQWRCSIDIHESSPLGGSQFITQDIPCSLDSIQLYLHSFRSCGTRIFSVELHCIGDNDCKDAPRPEMFEPESNIYIYTHIYSQTCQERCIDIQTFRLAHEGRHPQIGETIPNQFVVACGLWGQTICHADAPCTYGTRQMLYACINVGSDSNEFVGVIGEVDHIQSCQPKSMQSREIQQYYCINLDETCNIKSACSLSAKPFAIPYDRPFIEPKPHDIDDDMIELFEKYEQASFDHSCDEIRSIFPQYVQYQQTNGCFMVAAREQCYVELPPGAKVPATLVTDFSDDMLVENWQLILLALVSLNGCDDIARGSLTVLYTPQIYHADLGTSFGLVTALLYDQTLALCTEWACIQPSDVNGVGDNGVSVSPPHVQMGGHVHSMSSISPSLLSRTLPLVVPPSVTRSMADVDLLVANNQPHNIGFTSFSNPFFMSIQNSDDNNGDNEVDAYQASACYLDTIPCPRGCGVYTHSTQPRCKTLLLKLSFDGGDYEPYLEADTSCAWHERPSPVLQCLMTTGCALFQPQCRLKGTSQALSRENCSTQCDMTLCGKHELEIVCKGYVDHQLDPSTAIDAPLEHCADELKQLGLSDGHVCENYLGCTMWGCSDFYPTIDDENDDQNGILSAPNELDVTQLDPPEDDDDEDGGDDMNSRYTTSKYTISPDLCSYMTPQQTISRACSSNCGHGTMERKVVCMENGRILRDHDVNSSRCGLYYARPFHRLPCHVPETQCRAEAQCAVGGGAYSTTMCRWLQTSKDCMPMCELNKHEDGMQYNDDADHRHNSNVTPPQLNLNAITSVITDVATHDETVDVLRRCIYRDTNNRHASSSSCYLASIPSTMSCETAQDACCWNPVLLAEPTSSKNTTPRPEFCPPQSPISGVTTFAHLLAGPNSNLCGSPSAPAPPSPDTPLIIHLDTEIPLCWVFAGVPGSMVSLYLAHPALPYLTFIDSYPALSGMNSYVRPTFTLDSSRIAAFLNPSQRDDITTLDKRHFASLIAVVNSQLYTVLDYIVLESSPWQSTPSRSDDATMTGSLALMCGDHPCFNGVCVDGQCQCYGGFSGPACSYFPLCEDTPDLQCEHGGAPIPTTFRPSSYMFDEGVIASLHTMEEQDRALDNAGLPSTAIAPCNRCQCIHHYSGTTCDQCDLQCSKFGKVADDCSRCLCQPGYYGEQCNCRHTYLPVHYHRAPRFLEYYFTNIKTVSLNTNAFTQWKNTLLHELAMDLQLPRSDLDIDRYGYNSAGKSTTFVVVFTIKSCLPFDLSRPDEPMVPPATYRVGNVTDLVMVTQLLADYASVYRTPEYNSTPLFFDYVAVMPEYQSQIVREDDDEDAVLSQPPSASSSFLLSLLESLLLTPLASPSSPHLTPAIASASPHHTAQTATTRPAQQPTTTQALFSPSAPLLLQSTYFTPSSTATGVGQSMNGGFVSAHPLIDEDCPSMDPSESTTPATCYTGATRRPTLDHVPYSKASHTSMSLALILIIVFCVIVPVLILVILLLILWRKRLLCFSDKSAKQDPSNSTTEDIDMTDMTLQEGSSTHSQTSNRSATRQSRRGGKPAPGGASANSRRSKRSSGRSGRDNKEASGSAMASTQSEMVELEDVDLHPEWKKFMGPQGEPIYVNNSTMQSSRIRPDADGNIRKKSLFHRPTIFGGGPKPQQTAAATTAPSATTSPPTIHEE